MKEDNNQLIKVISQEEWNNYNVKKGRLSIVALCVVDLDVWEGMVNKLLFSIKESKHFSSDVSMSRLFMCEDPNWCCEDKGSELSFKIDSDLFNLEGKILLVHFSNSPRVIS
jgi:hypothetical protein